MFYYLSGGEVGSMSGVPGGGGWDTLYSEVQCIMNNGHMGPSPLWTYRRLWKHYLPATSFAGGNKI